MNFLRNISIKAKLIVLVSISLVTIGYFTTVSLVDNFGNLSVANTLTQQIICAENFSTIVHELQKERGLSVGHIASKGTKNKDKVEVQRKATDLKIESLESDEQNDLFAKLSVVRKKVDNLGYEPLEALNKYTEIINGLLNSVSSTVRVTKDVDTKDELLAHLSFIKAKDKMGQIRAVLNATFTTNKFTKESFSKFSYLNDSYHEYLHTFSSFASASVREYYDNEFQDDSINNTKKMISVAFKNSENGNFGVTPDSWWKNSTATINILKKVEDFSMASIKNSVDEKRKGMYANVVKAFVFIGIIFCLLITASIFIISLITVPIHKVSEMLKQLAESEGDLTKKIVVDQQDELGVLSGYFNSFLERLREMVKDILDISQKISSGSENMSVMSEQTSKDATELAAVSNETAEAIVEMNKNIQEVLKGIDTQTAAVTQTSASSELMSKTVVEVLKNVENQASAVTQTTSAVEEIVASIKEVAGRV